MIYWFIDLLIQMQICGLKYVLNNNTIQAKNKNFHKS